MTSTSQSNTQPSTAPQETNGTTSHPPTTNVGQPYYHHHQDFNYNAHFRPYQFPPGYNSQSDYPMNNFPFPMNNYPPNYGQNLTLNQLLQQNHNSNTANNFSTKQSFPNYDASNSFQYPPNKNNYHENAQAQNFHHYPPNGPGSMPRYPYPFPNPVIGVPPHTIGNSNQPTPNSANISSPNRNSSTPNKNTSSSVVKSTSGDLSTSEKTENKADISGENSNERKLDESTPSSNPGSIKSSLTGNNSRTASPHVTLPQQGANDISRSTPSGSNGKTPVGQVKQDSSTSASPAPSSSNDADSSLARVNSPAVVKSPETSQAIPPTSSTPNSSLQHPNKMMPNYPTPQQHSMGNFFGYHPQQNGQMPPGPMNMPGPFPPGFHPPPPHQMMPGYPTGQQPGPGILGNPGPASGPPQPPMPPNSMLNAPPNMGHQHGQPLFGYPGMPTHPNMPPMGHSSSHPANSYPHGMPPFMHNTPLGPRGPIGGMPMMPNGPQNPGNHHQQHQQHHHQPQGPSTGPIPSSPMNYPPTSMATQTCFMKLMEMGNEPDRHTWVSHYFKFMDDINKPVITLPQIVKQTCDVYKLYYAVKERGGILTVVKNKRWKEISTQINININASAGYTLRKNYIKYLIDYECKFDRNGIDPAPLIQEIEALSASKKRKQQQSPAGSIASQDEKASSMNQSKNSSFNFPPPSPVGSQSSASSSLHQPPIPLAPPSSASNQNNNNNDLTNTPPPPRVNSTGPPTSQSIMNGPPQSSPFSLIKQQQISRIPRTTGGIPTNNTNNNIHSPQLPPVVSSPSTVVHHAPPGTMVNQHQQQHMNNKYSSSVLNNLMMMNQQHQQQHYPSNTNPQQAKQQNQQQQKQQHHHQQQPMIPHQHPQQHHQHPHHQHQVNNMNMINNKPDGPMMMMPGNPMNSHVKDFDMSIDQNSSGGNQNPRLFKNTPNMTQIPYPHRKASEFFPTGSIEASTVAESPKKKRLRPKDLPTGSLHATRILNGLRSSLDAELVWSLNMINIMLREDSGTVAQEFLSHFHLPTLVQNLANVWRKSLGLLINHKKFIDDMELPEFLTDISNQAMGQSIDVKTSQVVDINYNPDLDSRIYQRLSEHGISHCDFKAFLDKTLAKRKDYPEKHSKSGRLVVLENRETYRAINNLRCVSGEANRKRKFAKIMDEAIFKHKLRLRDYTNSYGSYDRVATICDYVIDTMDDTPKAIPQVGLEIESIEKTWLFENQVAALKEFIKNGGGDTTSHINFPTIGSKTILKSTEDVFNDSEILKENMIVKLDENSANSGNNKSIEISDCPVLSPPPHQGQKKYTRSKTPPPVINQETKTDKHLLKHYCPLKAREEIVYIGNASKPLCHIDDEREHIIQICLAASNIFRNLSFVAPADAFLSTNTSFLFIISQILLLAHRHLDDNEDWSSVEKNWDELDFEDDKNWWWIQDLRENSFVALINIAGQLKLVNQNEVIVKGILDSVLHWIICKSSQAVDPMPFQRLISPQRLALEALNRLSVHESNVDLLLNLKENEFFDENSKIFQLFNVLSTNLSMMEDQVIRELSISTMHYLVENSKYHLNLVNSQINVASQLLIKSTPCVISGLLTFIESTEMTTRRVIEQFGVQALQERPDLMGSSLELVRRAGSLIDRLISIEDGRSKITIAQEQRILNLATSRVLDATVAQTLSSAIHRLSFNSTKYLAISNLEMEKFNIPKLPSMGEINRLIEIADEKILRIAQEKRLNEDKNNSKDDNNTDNNRPFDISTMNNNPDTMPASSPASTKTDENIPDSLSENDGIGAPPSIVESVSTGDNNQKCSNSNSSEKDLPPPQLSEATTPKSVENNNTESNNIPSLILA